VLPSQQASFLTEDHIKGDKMSDTIRIKIGLFALSGALIMTSNAIGHEVGQWNWSGALSYLAGVAAGVAILFKREQARS